MVFFNCNACGEAVKKNQVEKHYRQQCRNCEVLSCVDCGKEFWGEEYQEHNKCMTEDEKFGGKSYKPKLNANKGEQKQELWVQKVQDAITKLKANPRLKNLLERLKEYPNIPRKQAKFENFLHNSLRVMDRSLATQAWNALSTELNAKETETVPDNPERIEQKIPERGAVASVHIENGKGKTKKEKNRKQDKETATPENAENGSHVSQTDEGQTTIEAEENVKSKKKNKNKHRAEEEEGPRKKKRKTNEVNEENNAGTTMDNEQHAEAIAGGQFKWEAAIIGVLKRQEDKEISVKKLRRKVLGEFYSRGGDGKTYSEERLLAKFMKKINNNPRIKVLRESVRLVN